MLARMAATAATIDVTRRLCGLVVMVLFVAFSVVHAQTITTGDIAGVIADPTGAVVPNATVTLKSLDTGETRTVSTNDSGAYRISLLKPGSYMISAQSAGLKTVVLAKVQVSVGQVTTINLTAKVQATQEVIEVTSTAGAVDTENANLTTTFTSNQVTDLPAPGGDISTVAFTAPGIVMSTAAGGGYGNFTSHGIPATSNLFTVNGNDYNDSYLNLNNSGASNLTLGQNEIQEASVVQNGYSVEYGRQAGAQVNYVTKSGSNAFHGDAVYSYNGDRFNANDFFNNANGNARPRAVSNQYAASFGGPAIRNKLFFFVDTEGIRYALPASGVVGLPSPQLQSYVLGNIQPAQQALYQKAFAVYNNAPGASRAVPVTTGDGNLQDSTGNLGCGQLAGTADPAGGVFGTNVPCADAYAVNSSNLNTEWLFTSRVDYNINDKNKIFFRYKTDHGRQPTETNFTDPNLDVISIQPQHEGQVTLTTVLSPTMVNNFVGSVLWYSAFFGSAQPIDKVLSTFPSWFNFNDGGPNSGGFYPTGLGAPGLGFNIFPQGRNSGQLGLIDDFSIVKGNHNLKMGVNFRKNRITDSSLLAGTYGYYTFNSLADFANGVTNSQTGSSYNQVFTPLTAAHIRLYNLAFYVQDEWNVKPNLKITYGIRMDRTPNPLCVDKCFSLFTSPFDSLQKGVDIPYNSSIKSGLSHAYYNVDPIVPQPRLGAVWSPAGSRGPTLRGGVGLFADLSPGVLVSSVFSNAPFPYSATVFDSPVGTPDNPASAAASALNQYNAFKTGFFQGLTLAQLQQSVPGGQFGAFPYFSPSKTFGTPEYLEWSFEVQQPLGSKNVLVATYSGNHGYNLLMENGLVNANVNTSNFPNGFGGLPVNAPDPRFLGVTQLTNAGYSNYNGVTVQFRRSFAYGLQGEVAYTWSHALDTISSVTPFTPFSFNNSLTEQTSPNVHDNYSNSDFDVRHNFTADFVWDTPWKFQNRILSAVTGWTVSGKFFIRSGIPYSLIDSQLAGMVSNNISSSTTLMPTTIDPHLHSVCGPSAVNTACYTASQFLPSGSEPGFGNVNRNAFRGPGYTDVDASIYKNFNITERFIFRVGASAFNVFNHPNFNNPNDNVAASGLGLITGTADAPTSAYGSFQGSAVSGRVMVITGRFTF